MATARKQAPQKDLTKLIAGLSVVLAIVAGYFGWGAGVVLWVGLLTASYLIPVPEFTGRKDSTGRPTPAHPGEQQRMDNFRRWSDMRWKLFTPNASWTPGWSMDFSNKQGAPWWLAIIGKVGSNLQSTRAAWLVGIFAGLAVAGLPRAQVLDPYNWYSILNGVLAAIVVWQFTGSARAFAAPSDPSPGVQMGYHIPAVFSFEKKIAGIALYTFSGVVAVGVAVACYYNMGTYYIGAYTNYGSIVVGVSLGILASWLVVYKPWSDMSLGEWRELVATRATWIPRWESMALKGDNPPYLISHERFGAITVDTFEAPSHLGAAFFASAGSTLKLANSMGANMKTWILGLPNTDSQGQPMAGTYHPTRFKVVYCPLDQIPQLDDHTMDEKVVELLVETALAEASDAEGLFRYVPLSIDLITVHGVKEEPKDMPPQDENGEFFGEPEDEDELINSAVPVWEVKALSVGSELTGSYMRDALQNSINIALVTVDPRKNNGLGVLYLGDSMHEEVLYSPQSGVTYEYMENLVIEEEWRGRWGAVLKQAVNAPKPEVAIRESDRLAGARGAEIHSQPFVTLNGESPDMYFRNEDKLKATLQGAPFVAITGYPGQGQRPGDRHSQAFCVYWSSESVPDGPTKLAPGERGQGDKAAKWVLAGRINEAFRAARLDQPEVAEVRCLTDRTSRYGHIWEIKIRMYGATTLSMVRGKTATLRGTLGAEWLRVGMSDSGFIVIYAGARPQRVGKAIKSTRDMDRLVELDWEQAFLDSNVSGVQGTVPSLISTSTMPKNDRVRVLDFQLPDGLSPEDVKGGVAKLRTNTANAFIDVRLTEKADVVRILASETSPISDRAPIDWEVMAKGRAIPFGTGVDGEPVYFDPKDDPHALLAGVTGAGKSVLAQVFLVGFLIRKALVYVIDPVKGGADFQFAKDHAVAFASTVHEAAGVMESIYQEVIRRKNVNAQYGVGSYLDLPDDVRPAQLVILMDEFTSLMQPDTVPPKSDDMSVDAEREAILATNHAKAKIGTLAGKIAREARSAGCTLLLGTQKLTAKMLDTIPGANDLKTNLARVLLGNASSGDRASALRNFVEAPPLGSHIPKGRGLWESLTANAVIMQTWYAPQEELFAQLSKTPPLDPSLRLDVSIFEPKEELNAAYEEVTLYDYTPQPLEEVSIDWGDDDWGSDDDDDVIAHDQWEPGDREGVVVVGGVEVIMEAPRSDITQSSDALAQEDTAQQVASSNVPVEQVEPHQEDYQVGAMNESTAVIWGARNVVIPSAPTTAWPDFAPRSFEGGAVMVSSAMLESIASTGSNNVWVSDVSQNVLSALDEVSTLGEVEGDPLIPSPYGWWKIDAVEFWLDCNPQFARVVWVDSGFSVEDDLGIERRESVSDMLTTAGIEHTLVDVHDVLTPADIEQVRAALGVTMPEVYEPVDVQEPVPVDDSEVYHQDIGEPQPAHEEPAVESVERHVEPQDQPLDEWSTPDDGPRPAPRRRGSEGTQVAPAPRERVMEQVVAPTPDEPDQDFDVPAPQPPSVQPVEQQPAAQVGGRRVVPRRTQEEIPDEW